MERPACGRSLWVARRGGASDCSLVRVLWKGRAVPERGSARAGRESLGELRGDRGQAAGNCGGGGGRSFYQVGVKGELDSRS